MRWYQPIECDNTIKNPLVCDNDNLTEYGFDKFSFKKGNVIDKWNSNIFLQALKLDNDGDPDDALQNHLMIPIYSHRLVEALNNGGIQGIQYLPINILRPNGEHLKGFSIANFLNFVSAFDYDHSVYNRISDDFPNPNVRGQIAGVRKFVLKGEKMNGLDIIRLRDYDSRFFVSERFKKLFNRGKFHGYSFIEVDVT